MPKKKGERSGNSSGEGSGVSALPDARQRMAADRLLQLEINRALEDLADNLPDVSDLRLARVLMEVLEPSWNEHVSFQDQALFPIILERHAGAGEAGAMIDRFRMEHAEIEDRHLEVRQHIATLIRGQLKNADAFGYLLRGVFETRRRHFDAEYDFETSIASSLTPADIAALDSWTTKRPRPSFPLNFVIVRRH
jgi:hypothetical protein